MCTVLYMQIWYMYKSSLAKHSNLIQKKNSHAAEILSSHLFPLVGGGVIVATLEGSIFIQSSSSQYSKLVT